MLVYGPDLFLGLVIGEGAVLDVSGSTQLVGLIKAVQIFDRILHRHIGHEPLCVHPVDTHE